MPSWEQRPEGAGSCIASRSFAFRGACWRPWGVLCVALPFFGCMDVLELRASWGLLAAPVGLRPPLILPARSTWARGCGLPCVLPTRERALCPVMAL